MLAPSVALTRVLAVLVHRHEVSNATGIPENRISILALESKGASDEGVYISVEFLAVTQPSQVSV